MKKLVRILSGSALAGGILLTALNSSASPCFYSNSQKGTSITNNSPGLIDKQSNLNNLGFLGMGLAAVAGLLVAGMVYKKRLERTTAADTIIPEDEWFYSSSFSIPIYKEALSSTVSDEEVQLTKIS